MTPIALGDFEIAAIRHAVYWWDGGVMFGVVPKTLWAVKAPPDERNRIPAGFNSYLIRTGRQTILIETGSADKQDPRSRERMRAPLEGPSFAQSLAALGIDSESIDIVVNSHLHWDHCSGNTEPRNGGFAASFPRATYYAPRGEWEHAHERLARDRVSYIDANYDPLIESGQMTLVEGEREIAPGIWMRPAPGHNRDMTIVTAESRGSTFCFLSDLVPFAAHLTPTWLTAFDLYPLTAIEQKTAWLGRAAEEGWICGFGHDPVVDFARIAADPKTGFRLA